MTPETVLTIARESLTVTTLLAAPLLLVTLVTGVIGRHPAGRNPDQ